MYFVHLQHACAALGSQPAGTFLVRPAEMHAGFALSLVLVNGRVQHFKIIQDTAGRLSVSFVRETNPLFVTSCFAVDRRQLAHLQQSC